MDKYKFLFFFTLTIFLPSIVFAGGGGSNLGENLSLVWIIPFTGILLSIALFPLFAEHFWHHHYPKIAIAWALVFSIPFLISYGSVAVHELLHIYFLDYIPFIIVLWGLFTASGGILLRGTLVGTAKLNTALLTIGTCIASVIGTTGASMVLIRPLIRANQHRKNKVHLIVFFIFLVSNIGGSLTPLGDPPLFLGFLHGVPFFWTAENMLMPMIFLSVILLIIFYFVDSKLAKNDEPAPVPDNPEPIKIVGNINFLFLGGIIAGVLMSGIWKPGDVHFLGIHLGIQNIARDVLIIVMGLLSLKFTAKELRDENGFTWEPIREVAYLFAGIFACIIPALAILKAGEKGSLNFIVEQASSQESYFWLTGILSSFLDNAPTYLTFFNMALGSLGLTEAQISEALRGASNIDIGAFESYLLAISMGAVFMGANTYIGNAPNFMTKAIAEENKIKMPSFFGYMAWSFGILMPLFLLVSWIFF